MFFLNKMWTKERAEDAVARGLLFTYDLNDLNSELPGFITEEIKRSAFNNELRLRFDQISRSFNEPRNARGDYSVAGEILETISDVYGKAKNSNIQVNFDFKTGIEKLLVTSDGNFMAQRCLYRHFLKDSSLPLTQNISEKLLESLSSTSSGYVSEKLKRAKQLAKDSKREIRVEISYIPKLLKTLEQVRYAKSFYPENWDDVEEKIDDIKDLAYKRGVVTLRECVKDYPQDNGKYKRVMNKAAFNERGLSLQ